MSDFVRLETAEKYRARAERAEAALADAKAEALREAATAADAGGDPEQGPVHVSTEWLRDRAARIESEAKS